jgi:tight adherence protein C
MTPAATGALLGLAFSAGLLLVVRRAPWARRPRLADRIAPYLGQPALTRAAIAGTAAASAATGPATAAASAAATAALERRRWFQPGDPTEREPARVRVARWLDRGLGGAPSIRRRLTALGSERSVEEFRADQVTWAAVGLVVGGFLGVLVAVARAELNGLVVVVLAGTGLVAGGLGPDWWLSVLVRRRAELLRTELPVVAELLALAVTAGESPAAALRRVCRVSHGELGRELATTLAESQSGAGLAAALESLAARTTLEPLTRFVDGVVIALERGTPLAEVLRAQAADVREAGKRSLLATGGRREILMMVPVVFLILPITVLFALYPGLVSITMLTE